MTDEIQQKITELADLCKKEGVNYKIWGSLSMEPGALPTINISIHDSTADVLPQQMADEINK